MSQVELFRSRLKSVFLSNRKHMYRMLANLSLEDIQWKNKGTEKAMSIYDILRHIVNTEVFWLRRLDDNHFDVIRSTDKTGFEDLLVRYKEQEQYYLDRLTKAHENSLKLTPIKYNRQELIQRGTFGWIVIKVSIHAFHHAGQISHIRYSLNNPPKQPLPDERSTWWWASEAVIALANSFFE